LASIGEGLKVVENSSICVDCGLCCDGVLYDHAKVAPGEEERMVAAGLEVFDQGSDRVFRQPCPHSSCGGCTIYETRFQICHSFECKLLRSVKGGECSSVEAHEKIAAAKRLLDKVVTMDPQARSAGGRQKLRSCLAEMLRDPLAVADGTPARRLLAIVALDSFLKRWFRLAHEKPPKSNAPVNAP